jgi:hypothetical protein
MPDMFMWIVYYTWVNSNKPKNSITKILGVYWYEKEAKKEKENFEKYEKKEYPYHWVGIQKVPLNENKDYSTYINYDLD